MNQAMNQAWMYKGKESKLFNEDEFKQAESDGWFDNPEDAANTEGDPKKSGKKEGAASGATPLKNKE